jgi:hypothetical protein
MRVLRQDFVRFSGDLEAIADQEVREGDRNTYLTPGGRGFPCPVFLFFSFFYSYTLLSQSPGLNLLSLLFFFFILLDSSPFLSFHSLKHRGYIYQQESGWKYVHGDVFRFPRYKSVFAACCGTGVQLLTMSLALFTLAVAGSFLPYNRGEMLSALVLLYCFTAGIAGYYSSRLYRQLGGRDWSNNILLTTILLCGPLLLIFMYLNTVAIIYRSTQALPFGTIVVMIVLWALVTFPLTVLGGIKVCSDSYKLSRR